MHQLANISVILPSLDPDEKLHIVIEGLLEQGFQDIILINDGSQPDHLHYFTDSASAHPEVTLLQHETNLGKGAALKTGFRWFLENRPEGIGVITVDGDNQHHPEDCRACALQMLQSKHLVLGCRDFSQPQVPFRSRMGNKITCGIFRIVCGLRISDTQTGLRAIPRKALRKLVEIKGDRFEYETNMLLSLKEHGIVWEEVKIRTVYLDENKSSHFRVFEDSWRIYRLILAHFFWYLLSSLLGFLIEEGIFALLSWLLSPGLNGFMLAFVPISVARLLSSLFNFYMNKKVVFRSKEHTGKAMLRYYALAIPLLIAQVVLSYGVFQLFRITEAQIFLRSVIHALVMIVLFIISYTLQQRWVFSSGKHHCDNEETDDE